jgi:hypothetical protein
MEKVVEVPREYLKRSWAGKFFPEKLGIGAPETNGGGGVEREKLYCPEIFFLKNWE